MPTRRLTMSITGSIIVDIDEEEIIIGGGDPPLADTVWDVTGNPHENVTLSNGNLTASSVDDAEYGYAVGTRGHDTGKHYFEILAAGTATPDDEEVTLCLVDDSYDIADGQNSAHIWRVTSYGFIYHQGDSPVDLGFSVAAGQSFGLWYNADTGKIWVGNAADELSGDPEAGTGESLAITAGTNLRPAVELYASAPPTAVSATLNCEDASGTFAAWNDA